MLYILAPHAEDNLKVRWIRSPFRAHGPTAEMPRQAGPVTGWRGSGGLAASRRWRRAREPTPSLE